MSDPAQRPLAPAERAIRGLATVLLLLGSAVVLIAIEGDAGLLSSPYGAPHARGAGILLAVGGTGMLIAGGWVQSAGRHNLRLARLALPAGIIAAGLVLGACVVSARAEFLWQRSSGADYPLAYARFAAMGLVATLSMAWAAFLLVLRRPEADPQ